VVALFSAMLRIYYALLKSDEILLFTVNSAGCVLETLYIAIYLAYAPKKAKVRPWAPPAPAGYSINTSDIRIS
jgi:solute carrier family 50 protein (sugar transporter)